MSPTILFIYLLIFCFLPLVSNPCVLHYIVWMCIWVWETRYPWVVSQRALQSKRSPQFTKKSRSCRAKWRVFHKNSASADRPPWLGNRTAHLLKAENNSGTLYHSARQTSLFATWASWLLIGHTRCRCARRTPETALI